MEILTVEQLAAFLGMSQRSVYELTHKRVRVGQTNPLPFIRINGNVRFVKSDIEKWVTKLTEETTQKDKA